MNNNNDFEDVDTKKFLVRYKLRNDLEEYTEWYTKSQYEHIKNLPILEYCKMIKEEQ